MENSPDPIATTPEPSSRKSFAVLILLSGAYALAYLVWFGTTPLGQVPVLDGRENLLLARQIAEGALPPEPFFRAMLYPALLSLFAKAGLSESEMLTVAGVLGVLFHVLMVAAVFGSARLLWRNTKAAWVSGLLVGFYPIGVYFAAEPLDTAFSLSLVACAVYLSVFALHGASRSTPRMLGMLASAGVLLALAILARPNFLPLASALVMAALIAPIPARRRVLGAVAAAAGIVPPLLAYAAWQQAVSGTFRFMPWQGGYSLWVANGPDANGRYYAQKSMLAYEGPHQNPARIESEMLYRQETNATTALPAEIDRYWRDKTREAVLADPARWGQLELKKLYYFLNDFEQYNNKTFSFHQARSPLLRWNPLSWGVLLTLATIGVFAIGRPERNGMLAIGLFAAAYLAGGLLVFAGDRFRFPLVPFAAIFAGGTVAASLRWKEWSARRKAVCAFAVTSVLVVAFSRFAGVHDTSTYVQDRLLLANAALRAGDDAAAQTIAREILQASPDRSDARNIAATARFNQHLAGTHLFTSPTDWRQLAEDLESASTPSTEWIRAVARWNAGEPERAAREWRNLSATRSDRIGADSLAMLVLTGAATAAETEALRRVDWQRHGPYVWAARMAIDGEPLATEVRKRITPGQWEALRQMVSRLLPGTKVP